MRYLTLVLALLFCGTAFAQTPDPADTQGGAAVVAPAAPDVVAPVAVEAPDAGAPVEAPDAGALVVSEDAGAPVADSAVPAPPVAVPVPVTLPEAVTDATAPTSTVPTSDEAAGTVVGQMVDAAKNGHWTVFGGLLLLLIIWLFNRMGLAAKVGSKAVPWVTLGTGAVLATAVGLVHGVALFEAVKLGVLEGLVAVGLWEALFKHVSPKAPKAPAAS